MKIAIHQNTWSFSERWVNYCKTKNIPYKIVNCFDNDIIEQLNDCDALMWHYSQGNHSELLAAKSILYALEHKGVKVFPNFQTSWHFDNKVAQKYLLEAINAPIVPSYVFYDKKRALQWVEDVDFPKVFKLKGGAASQNVKLVKNKKEANKLIKKAFDKGFKQFDGWSYFKDSIKKYQSGSKSVFDIGKAFGRMLIGTEFSKKSGNEVDYVYFQDFIPNNNSDIRVVVIKDKAFAVRRMVCKGGFKASGSGIKKYDKEDIDIRCVEIGFKLNELIKSQSVACDFVFDTNNNPLLLELSYGFAIEFYDPCPGYWDNNMVWYEGSFVPQDWMVENIVDLIQKNLKS